MDYIKRLRVAQPGVDAVALGTDVGYDINWVKKIMEYLVEEKLAKTVYHYNMFIDSVFPTFYDIAISHKGVKEVEKANDHPSRATKHFRPRIVYNVSVNYAKIDTTVHHQVFKNIKNSKIINES
jgi:hypothetical protein